MNRTPPPPNPDAGDRATPGARTPGAEKPVRRASIARRIGEASPLWALCVFYLLILCALYVESIF
ncbi:MAG: hypothetical protein LBS70_09275 [Candidatus Accumulibacter sp.]|nr:hypothetical protein [Accumulibacter sp.]